MSLAEKSTYLLGRLAKAYDYVIRRCAARHGLTSLQGELLMAVAEGAGGRGVTALSRELLLAQPTVSAALAVLAEKGLVDVVPGVDKRKSTPRPTARGLEVAAELRRCIAVLESAAGRLPREMLEPLFLGLLQLTSELYKSGVVAEARICLTCRYLSRVGGKYYCSLLKSFMSVETIRVSCADHKPAASQSWWR